MRTTTLARVALSSALILAVSALLTGAAAAQSPPPTPESVLGFRVGADFKLATYDESLAYFRQLAAASDRVELREVGRTSMGKPWVMALVSAPENLARVEEYREIARRLAYPQGEAGDQPMLTEAEARQLARTGKAIVHIDGGLHASEVAHAQHTVQLAYDLASSTDPAIESILDEVILMLWPSVNPDGQNIVVDWYRGNVGGPYEVSPVPWLYQKYVGHDNNRDAYMLNMIESRVLARTWREWEPQIIYIHHQSSPFPTRIWLPPFAEPIATRVHPLMSRTVNTIGMLIAQKLEGNGQVGATHMGTGFDAWYPGYIDYMPMLRNVAAWWTETALYAYATPKFYTLRDFPESRRDLRSESLYSSPWEGGWWHLRDAVDYMLTASLATMEYAAKFREDLLYNRYQAGRDTILKYRQEPPFAYVVPQQQRDPVAAVEMLRRLAFNGARVYALGQDRSIEGLPYSAGDWVIPMDQENAELVRQVLEVQEYPDLREYPDGPPEQPYDAAGWSLPHQMGVRTIEVSAPLDASVRGALTALRGEPAAFDPSAESNAEVDPTMDRSAFDSVPGLGFDTDPVAVAIVPPAGEITGRGSALSVDPAQNNAFRAVARAWREGARVTFAGGDDGYSGYMIAGMDAAAAGRMVDELALRAEWDAPGGAALREPRIGLYRPWTASMDEGWTRWVLERYEIPFTSLRDAEVRAGNLSDRYDAILIADIRGRSILNGHEPGTVPARYAGGIGEAGVRALRNFVERGGTLVTFNQATRFAIEQLGLPVTDAAAELSREDFFLGTSQLEAEVDTLHPLMAGMPARASITTRFSPILEPGEGFDGEVLISYPESGDPLLSGYLLGAEFLHGKAAALRVRHGEGQVVLLGFAPQWRGQPFGTLRIFLNALLLPRSVVDGLVISEAGE
jgi:hypothetical protein